MGPSDDYVVQLTVKKNVWRQKLVKSNEVSGWFVLTVPSLSIPNRSAISMIRAGRNVPSTEGGLYKYDIGD